MAERRWRCPSVGERARPPSLAIALAFASVLATATAGAQSGSDEATRSAAATLGEAGIARYNAGDYAGALEKFDQAEQLLRAPTLGVRAARCLDKLGRLVDAAERYQSVITMTLDASWPEVHRQAQRDAAKERAALMTRIPSVVVEVSGQERIEIDGKPRWNPTGTFLVDPGAHTVALVRGGERKEQSVSVREGEVRHLSFVVEGPRASPSASVAPVPAPPPHRGGPQRALGWAGVGLGAIGLVVGGVAGAMAVGRKNDLDGRCPDQRCPPSAWDDNDGYDTLRAVSTTGFVIGAVAAVAGVVLLVTAPRQTRGANGRGRTPWSVGSFFPEQVAR